MDVPYSSPGWKGLAPLIPYEPQARNVISAPEADGTRDRGREKGRPTDYGRIGITETGAGFAGARSPKWPAGAARRDRLKRSL